LGIVGSVENDRLYERTILFILVQRIGLPRR
jgi:hypothetical protein